MFEKTFLTVNISGNAAEVDSKVQEAADEPEVDNHPTGSPLRTVCNDTYTSDAYLVPISNRKNDADDTECENCNHATPLLDHVNSVQRNENGMTTFGKQYQKVTVEMNEPAFKRNYENTLPQNKSSKKKQTIYPSEHVTLLSDTGSSRCLETAEIALHQATTQC